VKNVLTWCGMVKGYRILGAGISGRESGILVGEKVGGEERVWEASLKAEGLRRKGLILPWGEAHQGKKTALETDGVILDHWKGNPPVPSPAHVVEKISLAP